jgi:GNAT superfamily N-acetyltransferase
LNHLPRAEDKLITSLVFQTVQPKQLTEIERVMRAAFKPYVTKLGREITETSYIWLPDAVVAGDVYAGSLDNEILCGAATATLDDVFYIEQIAVNPDYQKSGIGSWLLNRLEQQAITEGFTTLSLDTAMMMDDLLRFYRRAGFEIVRTGPPKHGRDSHLRVYLSKFLQKQTA